MRTVKDILLLSAEHLQNKGVKSPRLVAEELLASVMGIKRLQVYLEFERPLQDDEVDQCRKKLLRLSKKEPLQYVLEEVDFFGCTLYVNPSVLIPRNETEQLVEKVAQELSRAPLQGKVLFDLCAGSGCVGISLKKKFPLLNVVCTDISKDALLVAKRNAERNSVEVEFIEGDLFSPLSGRKADFLVSNPPYVTEEEWMNLDREVKDFEPRRALVAGLEGTEIYKKISIESPRYLNPGAKIWLEIGASQGQKVKEIFSGKQWKRQALSQDYAGRDRFFFLEFE